MFGLLRFIEPRPSRPMPPAYPTAQDVFRQSLTDVLTDSPLLPLHEMADDPARKELDRRFASDVLGLAPEVVADGGPLDLLREKLGAEPSVRGNK
ncbi:MAG: hypothetical protein WAU84_07750, partial [Thermoguttaceae bacterium]